MIFKLRARIIPSIIAFVIAANAAGIGPIAARELPSDSVYRLDLSLVDQDARASKLSDLRGGPVLVAMFYTSCKFMCPLIIDTLQRTAHALSDDERAHLRVVLVTFDSNRDTPQVLKKLAVQRHLDLSHWMLARTDVAGVRKLAAVLDVQYRAIANGDFDHSGVITLLDGDGHIAARSDRIGELDPALLSAVHRTLAATTP